MAHLIRRKVARYASALLAGTLMAFSLGQVGADTQEIDDIRVESSVTSEFPDGIRFKVNASGKSEIRSVAIRFRVGQRARGAYDYLCPAGSSEAQSGLKCEDIEPALAVDGELFWRTDTGARYIPPGTIITYSFEIEDSEATHRTEEREFIYHDVRFEWQEVSEGPITVSYHGPVKTRAELVLDAILQTMDVMGPLLGAATEGPIRVTMYNNVKEMLGGLPPGSTTIRRELITAGQAFSDAGMLLTLGGGSDAAGTASHEVTHILVYRAGNSPFGNLPAWLNEGLAEYGNISPEVSYDIALDFAIATNRLLPVMNLGGIPPGNPENAIIFYGQSRSIIKLMVDELGEGKMKELMAVLKTGKKIDAALQQVYGLTILELDNVWRDSIGAARYEPPELGRVAPTPIPMPPVLLYSLTPQPDTEAIGDKVDEPTPTPTAEPTATTIPLLAAASGEAAEPSDASEAAATSDEEKPPATGAGCFAPLPGSTAPVDVGTVGILFGLAGLAFRRRVPR